ncbi:DUF2157 domain-containing protein [Pseudomonas sp. FME51]|uniref:DUF2157 domain-containing protein n=1 Tax=Pseudomonas sp. FME51 TaxID=2742609 RepID=UPI001867B5B7|nr:DUF2157 domain-containing protein [Pseudomonas sp. FME51]
MDLNNDIRRRDQLLRWTEQGLLTPEQLAPEQPQPAARHWLLALDRVLAFYGCLLLALGVIFFFAFNWEQLHRFIKLGLAMAALSGFAGAALVVARGSVAYRAALFGASLTTGGLLALIGQTYQTGADIWQLFAVWAALSLPWALLSRSVACWALFWGIANLALLRYLALSTGWFVGDSTDTVAALMKVAVFNVLLLLLFESRSSWLPQTARAIQRLAGAGLLAALALAAMLTWWRPEQLYPLLVLGAVYLLGIPVYQRVRRDLLMLALQLYSLVVVLAAGLARLLEDIDGLVQFWALGLFLLLGSAVVSVWLQRWHREEGV